jgi:hypothetical protein
MWLGVGVGGMFIFAVITIKTITLTEEGACFFGFCFFVFLSVSVCVGGFRCCVIVIVIIIIIVIIIVIVISCLVDFTFRGKGVSGRVTI